MKQIYSTFLIFLVTFFVAGPTHASTITSDGATVITVGGSTSTITGGTITTTGVTVTTTTTGDITLTGGTTIDLASTVSDPVLVLTSSSNLCDVSCDLTITFPDGGTLTATEALTFTFGDGGAITLGEGGSVNVAVQPASLDFPTGGALFLDVGESITFGVGGSIDTASGGNFNYTDIEVTTDVEFDVLLDEGGTGINVSNITATGNGGLTITADAEVYIIGTLSVDGNLNLNSSSTITQIDSSVVLAGVLNTVSSDATLLLANTIQGVTTSTGDLTITGVTTTSGEITISGGSGLVLTGGTTTGGEITVTGVDVNLTESGVETLSVGEITLATDFSNVAVGFTFTGLADGNDCTVINTTQCVTDNGSVYEWVDGELVLIDGAGTLDWKVMLLFACMLFYSRRRSFSIR